MLRVLYPLMLASGLCLAQNECINDGVHVSNEWNRNVKRNVAVIQLVCFWDTRHHS